MKKLLTMGVALTMAAGITLGVAACGNNAKNGSPTGKLPEENFHAAWVAAFDMKNFENFKIEGTLIYQASWPEGAEVEDGPERTTSISVGVRANGYEHYTESGDPEWLFPEPCDIYCDGKNLYEREFEEIEGTNKWEKTNRWQVFSGESYILEMLEELYFGAEEHATDFTFDTENGLYIWKQNLKEEMSEGGECDMTICFSFKDGKIAHFVHDRIEKLPNDEKFQGAVTEYRFEYDFTYGGQTVTLPDDLPNPDDSQDENEEGNGSQDGNEEGSGSQTGKLPEKNFEAAWAAAFDTENFENFKINIKIICSFPNDPTQQMTISGVKAGNLEYASQTIDYGDNKTVISNVTYYDGEMSYYKDANGKWEKSYNSEGCGPASQVLQSYILSFANCVNQVQYSEEQDCYITTTTLGDVKTTLNFIFRDGKLSKLIMIQNEQYNARITVSITYGGQKVILPQVRDE